MSNERMTITLSGNCPICDALIMPSADVEESEILFCIDCQSMLVVELCQGANIIMAEAPRIEEDWGE